MLKYLFACCAALALLSSASAGPRGDRLGKLDCTAGQIAKFDGERWVCADLRVDGSSVPGTLLDSEGDQVGDVVGIGTHPLTSEYYVRTLVRLPDILGPDRAIVLDALPDRFADVNRSGQEVYFDGPGCTETPSSGLAPAFRIRSWPRS
jgi:hypothetical protein